MIYDLQKEFEIKRADAYYEKLKTNGKKVEIKSIELRNLKQNNYLHLIIGWFACECGYTIDYVKRKFYKQTCNPDIYIIEVVNKFTGEVDIDFKSSKDVTEDEMTLSITRFRNWSGNNGVYLPSSDEREFLEHVNLELKKQKEHL